MEEKDPAFIIISDWMLELDLSIVERTIYAVIYGFSQRRMGIYNGSRSYLAMWCSCTTRTVDTALARLISLGLINKTERYEGGVKLCTYTANYHKGKNFAGSEKISQGVGKKLQGCSEKIAHNNIEDNIDNNIATTTGVADAPQQPIKKFSYRDKLIAAGVTAENADRLLANRKANNLKNTEAAYNKLMGALEQVCNGRGVTYDEAVEYAGKKGWGFIDPSWNLDGLKARSNRTRTTQTIGDYLNKFAR